MNTLQWILLISILLMIDAQWYIKKTYHTKYMNYPNPGKRYLSTKQSNTISNMCDLPFSQSSSYQPMIKWIFTCGYRRPYDKFIEGSFRWTTNHNFQNELLQYETTTPRIIRSYLNDRENPLDKFSRKFLRYIFKHK